MTDPSADPLRVVFAGTPAPAVPTLRALVGAGHAVVAVVTRPDAPLGRKRVLTPSPVAVAAEELGIPVIRAATLDEDVTARIEALRPDLGVVVAYGGLVRPRLLEAPRAGWINLHFSLLPAWRGAAPLQHALIAGDQTLGTSVFQLVEALDAGDVFDRRTLPAGDAATAGELLSELAEIGAGSVVDVVAAIAAGTAVAEPQTGEPTRAPKLSAADGRIDPADGAARAIARFRGVTPEPGASVEIPGGTLKLHDVASAAGGAAVPSGTVAEIGGAVLLGTADGAIELRVVQPPGKPRMSAADWWRGAGRSAS